MIKALELYSGIGGFSKACEDFDIYVKYAFDQNDNAIATYNMNFNHKATKFNLEKFSASYLDSLDVDFIWLSPPCQPYTLKGIQRDLEDNRTESFKRVCLAISTCKELPTHIALENVKGFKDSNAREIFLKILQSRGYNVEEHILCPSELGIPNRRERYYLCASLKKLKPIKLTYTKRELKSYIKDAESFSYIDSDVISKFGKGFRIVDFRSSDSYTTCFTSSYSKAWMHSGAYLRDKNGIRLFEPEEIASLLGFGSNFIFPNKLSKRAKYKLIGNSLSVDVVKVVFSSFNLR